MNASSLFTLRSWVNLLLFEIVCCAAITALSFLAAYHLMGPVGGREKEILGFAAAGSFLWVVMSAIALKAYLGGMSFQMRLVLMAALGSPVAVKLFCLFWNHRSPVTGVAHYYSSLVLLTILVSLLSLIVSGIFVDLSLSLRRPLSPMFKFLSFKPSS